MVVTYHVPRKKAFKILRSQLFDHPVVSGSKNMELSLSESESVSESISTKKWVSDPDTDFDTDPEDPSTSN